MFFILMKTNIEPLKRINRKLFGTYSIYSLFYDTKRSKTHLEYKESLRITDVSHPADKRTVIL